MLEFLSRIQSARERIPAITDKRERHRVLLYLTESLATINPAEAIGYALNALEIGQSLRDASMVDLGHLALVQPLIWTSRFADAKAHLDQANTSGEESNFIAGRRHFASGVLHQALLDLSAASQQFEKAYSAFEKEKIEAELAAVQLRRAIIDYDWQLYGASFEKLRQAVQLANQHGQSYLQPWIQIGLFLTYNALGFEAEARQSYDEGLTLASALGDQTAIALMQFVSAMACASRGEHAEAVETLSQVTESLPHESPIFVSMLVELSRNHTSLGDLDAAEENLRQAKSICERFSLSIRGCIVLIELASVLSERGQKDSAYEMMIEAKRKLPEGLQLTRVRIRLAKLLAVAEERRGDLAAAVSNYREYVSLQQETQSHQVLAAIAIAGKLESVDKERLEEAVRTERDRVRSVELDFQAKLEERERELAAHAIQLVQHDELFEKLHEKLTELQKIDAPIPKDLMQALESQRGQGSLRAFEERFRLIDPGFQRKLLEICPDLTRTELRVCMLIRLDISPKEIASLFFLSRRTIDSQRLSIRKKLKLGRSIQLDPYLRGL